MDKDILTVIAEQSSSFSKSQRQIAKYIIENYDKAAYMNAVKLAGIVGVSESTVVRFASMLGYDGYPGMKKALQEMIRNRLTSVQRIEVANDIIGTRDILTSVLTSDIDKIKQTLEEVDKQAFDQAVDMICNAKRLYILGLRASACLSSFMGFYMNFIFENVRIVNDTYVNEPFEQIMNIGEGDVFIAISFPRYSKETIKVMKYASNRHASTLAITDNAVSPISDLADVKLYAKSDMASFLDSIVAPLSLINALMVAVATRAGSGGNLSEAFHRLESVWEEYDVYEKNDNPIK